jgi:DNA invertase Pin-like site-specific DNA recombinase
MRVIGYARVSTRDQSLDVQLDQIKEYCKYRGMDLTKVYTDKSTGANTERPGFQDMMKNLVDDGNPLHVEAVIIFKLDRMGRSLLDLINITNLLKENGVDIVAISNNIDTTTKEGRLFFYIIASLAEYERELIIERTSLGREKAKEKNVKFGRKKKSLNMKLVYERLKIGVPKLAIAREFRVSPTTLYKLLEEDKKNTKIDKLEEK